jgi:hypothetical protein
LRTFFAALIAAAAIAAPASTHAAGKPVPALQVVATTVGTAAAGAGCIYSVTATWDGVRVGAVAMAVYDSLGPGNGFVDQGGGYVDPRPARSGSLSWTSGVGADSGAVRVVAVFRDHRGIDIGTTTFNTTCP